MTVVMFVGAVVGTGIGAVLRYWLARLPRWHGLPWGTIAANAIGSFLVGAVAAGLVDGSIGEVTGFIASAGLASGLTTFSTFALDAVILWKEERWRAACAYCAITFVTGTASAAAGWFAWSGLLS